MDKKIELSVIIASYNSKDTIEKCLESLRNQETDKSFEIIIVDSSKDDSAEVIKEKYPQTKLYRFSERKFCGDARNFGISKARGKITAFIDADCIASSNWVNEIIKAHQAPLLAVGGSIGNGNPGSYIGWAAYFCEFSQWMPNKRIKYLRDIAGANMSYKKEIFEQYGNFVEGTYCSDTELHWRLGKDGHHLKFMPSIAVSHYNIEKFTKFIKHECFHGRSFAKMRVRSQKFSNTRRYAYAFFSFLIPTILFLRVGSRNIRNNIYALHFLKTLPLLILGLISWSLGECVGYLEPRKGYEKNSAVR